MLLLGRRKAMLLMYGALCFVVLILVTRRFKKSANKINTDLHFENKQDGKDPPTKILYWLSPKTLPSKGTLSRVKLMIKQLTQDNGAICKQFQKNDIPMNCELSLNPNDVENSDAIVFSMFNVGYKITDLPNTRPPGQIWVGTVQESPTHSYWRNPLQNLINWTMTYRYDSDIWAPYGRKVVKSKTIPTFEPIMVANTTLSKWIAGKSKLVAGVISHCKTSSKREILVQKMNETEGLVDVYGACGNKPICSVTSNYNRKCDSFWLDFARDYKFFLAFENSLCIDYITEKFWRTLEIGVVPLVYGGGDYIREAPPNSFIDAGNFRTTEDLMEYLKMLDTNDDEYAKYFEWRRLYDIEEKLNRHRAWCNLCQVLSKHKSGITRLDKTYSNFKTWWNHLPGSSQPACVKPNKMS